MPRCVCAWDCVTVFPWGVLSSNVCVVAQEYGLNERSSALRYVYIDLVPLERCVRMCVCVCLLEVQAVVKVLTCLVTASVHLPAIMRFFFFFSSFYNLSSGFCLLSEYHFIEQLLDETCFYFFYFDLWDSVAAVPAKLILNLSMTFKLWQVLWKSGFKVSLLLHTAQIRILINKIFLFEAGE